MTVQVSTSNGHINIDKNRNHKKVYQKYLYGLSDDRYRLNFQSLQKKKFWKIVE